MKYFLIIVYFTFPHWGSPVGNGERLPHAESGEMANAYITTTRRGSSDGKRSIFRSRSESTIMNGTKNGTIVLNEKTERAVKAAFGAQNFIVNHKMRRESASESIF